MPTRRTFLLGLAACPMCAAAAGAEGQHWSYEGTGKPEEWGNLDSKFKACAVGAEQSPVNLTGGIKAQAGALVLNWKPEAFQVINNGHTIQANGGAASSLTLDGKAYWLKQFHFHAPSEHALDNNRSAMEVHFVHASTEGALTVVGVFLKVGKANTDFSTVMAAAPAEESAAKAPSMVKPSAFLPTSRATYRYEGSLTTPPCSEIVNWVVMENAVEVASADIAAFVKLFPNNARPIQPLSRRFLLRS